MRIPSIKKVEAQIDAYCETHPVNMESDWKRRYATVTKQHSALVKKWLPIQQLCPGDPHCSCEKHPLYIPLVIEGIKPLETVLRALCWQRSSEERKQKSWIATRLHASRKAKIDYKRTAWMDRKKKKV